MAKACERKNLRGKTSTYNFDVRDRLLTKMPDPSLGEPTVTFTYNPTGTRATMSDGSGSTAYSYDSRDRLLTKATSAGTLTYAYDPTGNVASIQSSNANGTSVSYSWDAANQLVSVTDNRALGMTTTAYTATGLPSTVTQPSGVGSRYGYDARDRATSVTWARSLSPAFGSWSYEFNGRGQRTSVTDDAGRHVAYGYDAISRLLSENVTSDPRGPVGTGTLDYTLDPAGNRLSRTSTLAALGAQSFTYDANDQLTTDGYDVNGNTTASDGHTYTYDFENRLVSKDSGAVGLVYDGDGNKVAKTANGVTTTYLVDSLNPTGYVQVLEELQGGTLQTRYTYGTLLVSESRMSGENPGSSYYGYDAVGNVSFLTDATGAVTDTYDYDAWGSLVGSTGTTPNTRLYMGEELDPDLGLIDLRARQYDPATGRFLTLDPMMGDPSKPISFNRSLFADGDPVNRRDPLGMAAQAAVAGGGTEYAELLLMSAILVAPHTVYLGTDGNYVQSTAPLVVAVSQVITCEMFIAASAFGAKPGGIFRDCKKYVCVAKCQSNGAKTGAYYLYGESNRNCSEATQNAKAEAPRGEYPRHCSCQDTEGFRGTGHECEAHVR